MALDGSMVVAANNAGTAYVWRMLRGASLTTHFEPLHKLRAHQGGEGVTSLALAFITFCTLHTTSPVHDLRRTCQ